MLLILALSAFVVERSRALRERDTTVRVMIAALDPGDVRDRPARPRLGDGLHGDRLHAAVRGGHLLAPPRGARGARARSRLAFVLVAAPAAGVHVLKPYQVARLTAFLHPSSNPQKEGYQQQESKIAIGAGAEDRPRRQRHPDPQRLRAREPDRLHLRGRRRAVRLRRRGRRAAALRAADLARAAHPRDVQGPVRHRWSRPA